MAAISEPILDVAGVGAELPMAVTVDREFLPAGRAGKGINRTPLHQFQMCVPPLVPAGIRAEPLTFPSRSLINGLAALLADRRLGLICHAVPPAKGFHSIDGNPQLFRYTSIPCPVTAQGDDSLFLFVLHTLKVG